MHAVVVRNSKNWRDSKNNVNQKKNSPQKRNKAMNNTLSLKRNPKQQTRTVHRPSAYVGIDMHKKTL